MTPLDKIELRDGYSVEIFPDFSPINPREWDNLGTMVAFHRRYAIGDDWVGEPDDLLAMLDEGDYIALPLYLYDHSIQLLSTRSWVGRARHAEWDSGKVGYIFVSVRDVKKEYGWKRLTKKRRAQIEEYLNNEVETYSQYMSGDVYGRVVLAPDGEELDSCFGYYGSDHVKSGLMWDVETHIAHHQREQEKLARSAQLALAHNQF